ncbi:MAG: hypothetical protein AAFV45_04140 [Pseudomonadota bacterium]
MTFGLDRVVDIGGRSIAAIVDSSLEVYPVRAAVAGSGRKTPLSILIHEAGVTSAIDINGRPLSLDVVEQRYPGMLAKFIAAITL